MYVCGVTPYDRSHLGHAMSYVIFDVLRRYLEYSGHKVQHVQNYTDIDDKIIARAQRLGIEPAELAEQYIREYSADMQALNVLPATVYPRATHEIPEMIEMIKGLIDKGYAYSADGDVYFRVGAKEDYGKLSSRNLESMLAGARVEPGAGKEHPMDFALWKGSKPGEPAWESPWGPGRPGWHIECSAMSLKYLGEAIDIHGGGMDLIFPHHENEIAQSEAYTGCVPFARFWLHHGLLQLGEEKMSKSLQNIVSISDTVERYGTDAVRLFILSSHYRGPLTYREEGLAAARRGAQRLRQALEARSDGQGHELAPALYRERFLAAMDDDLNTAQAVAALFDLAREINRAKGEGLGITAAQSTLQGLGQLLGLTFTKAEADREAAPFIDLLLEIRDDLRKEKQFALADVIRGRLTSLGIALEDTPEGTRWRHNE
jgi:cysteinyl-tRNA synthetase